MEMYLVSKRILKIVAQIIIALPLLSALAGLVLVVHQLPNRIRIKQLAALRCSVSFFNFRPDFCAMFREPHFLLL
jgi:hypothetical protein